MDLQDVTKDLGGQTNYRLEQRLEELMRTNPGYRNLSQGNQELIFKLIKKYQGEIRQGLQPGRLTVKEDKYYLFENRVKLGLSSSDLDQINRLLDSFQHLS